ncbi:hypothetical protein NAPIS_ORF00366 [Vairimorpha apis BRL 01]|uniref:Uncharacterized protein n=1 Tax=Vairimorpha apis BRL 01 TaxID=1037528 RepID=T0MG41_9MICR|nr:hypothetical protein NAPIS_ORF00366 [Vairimorpha apis BRL 01]
MEELTVVNHDIQSTILNNENEEIVENFITVPDMEELTVVNHDIQSTILNNENEEIVENFITVPDIEEPSIVEHIDHHINLKEEILNNNKDFDTKPVLISKEEFSKIILQEGKSFDIEENILINKIKHKESVILENKIIRDQDSNVYNENTHSLFHSRLMRLRDKFFQETEALRFISSIDKFINDIENIDFSSITEDQKESFIEQAKKYIKKAKELSKKKNHKKHYDLGYLSTILSFRLEGLKNIPTNKMENKRLIYENLQNISNVLSDLNKDLQDTKDNNNVKKNFLKK